MRHERYSGDLRVRQPMRELFGRGVALQRQREELDIVRALPAVKRDDRGVEIEEALAVPELFVVDAVAALDLAVLLRSSRLGVAMRDPGLFERENKVQRELSVVVRLHLADRKGEALPHLLKDGETAPLNLLPGEPEDA